MPKTGYLKTFLFIAAIFFAAQPCRSQEAQTPPAPAPAVSATQAQHALEVLQDDSKRTQLIQTLKTIANASPAAQGAPASAANNDNLGVQLLGQVSDSLSSISSQITEAARAISDFPGVWHWVMHLTNDPTTRDTLFAALWKLALVIGCALAVEWLVRRAVRKPLAAVGRYVPVRARHPINNEQMPAAEIDATAEDRGLRRYPSLAYGWQLIQRLPFVLLRLALELLPVVCFAAVGNLMLATGIGHERTPRLVILVMVNAYVLWRCILYATAAVVSPAASQPSLLIIRNETAAYVDVWATRIVTVIVFGVALANVALVLGLFHPAYEALIRLVVLVVHLFIVIIILQCRRPVAGLIRAPEGQRGALAVMRNRFSEIWHIFAIVLDLALWTIWALEIRDGYTLLLKYFISTIAVLAIARVISVAVLTGLDQMFRVSPDFVRQFPGLEARANRYFPALRATVSSVVAAITIFALLEVWGIDAAAWFSSGQVGGRLVSAIVTIAIAGVVALAIWELSNAAIEQHLTRLTRDGRYMRAARLRTFLPMLRTTLLSVILTIVALTALSELGVNIAPLLAGAGIVGIAIGFGSQKLVQDVITGLFLLLENAMQVGDFVTVSGGLSGNVENLSIRTIRLRAPDGSVHIIPFSSVTSVTNTNRGIGNAAISVNVAYKEDTDHVSEVLKEIAAQIRAEEAFKPLIRGDLEIWGVDKVDASMATIVGQIQCTDSGRWPVQREFYRRMKQRFQELGIEIARPSQTTVVVQNYEAPRPQSGEKEDEREPQRRASATRR
jgi:small-conductance mechanosensitive channel